MNAEEARERGLGAARGCLYGILGSVLVVLAVLAFWLILRAYVGD